MTNTRNIMAVVLGCLPMLGLAKSFDCLMEAKQTVELSSPVSGVLETVGVRRGDSVKKGQLLAALDTKVERASMEAARMRSIALGPTQTAEKKIEFAKQKFERKKQMAAQSLIPAQEMDDAEAELRIAQAELKTAQENREIAQREYQQQAALVNQRTLYSPFDGVVVDKILSAGELTESSGSKKAILKLAQINPLRVHLVLPDQLFGRLKVGEAVKVLPQYQGATPANTKVVQIDKLIDAASGTFSVFLELPNPKLEIPAGMRCKADL